MLKKEDNVPKRNRIHPHPPQTQKYRSTNTQAQAQRISSTTSVAMNAVAFFDAIKQGDLPRAQQLVYKNPSVLRTRRYLEHSPLIAAMFHGRWDVAEYLMQQKGIDVNAKDIMGRTALYYVCCRGRPLRLLEALVDAGADVTIQTDILHGSTLITRAVRTGREDVLTFLLERFCGVIDIDATGSVRESALSVACWDGRLDAVKLLLQYGAAVRRRPACARR